MRGAASSLSFNWATTAKRRKKIKAEYDRASCEYQMWTGEKLSKMRRAAQFSRQPRGRLKRKSKLLMKCRKSSAMFWPIFQNRRIIPSKKTLKPSKKADEHQKRQNRQVASNQEGECGSKIFRHTTNSHFKFGSRNKIPLRMIKSNINRGSNRKGINLFFSLVMNIKG